MSKHLNKVKETISNAIQTAMGVEEINPFGWPPQCAGLFHQAKRPAAMQKTDTKQNDKG